MIVVSLQEEEAPVEAGIRYMKPEQAAAAAAAGVQGLWLP
jgi:hypothetical protein